MLPHHLLYHVQLYGDYAEPFELSECKLTIIHCAGHYDPTLVDSLWAEIIDKGKRERESELAYTGVVSD